MPAADELAWNRGFSVFFGTLPFLFSLFPNSRKKSPLFKEKKNVFNGNGRKKMQMLL